MLIAEWEYDSPSVIAVDTETTGLLWVADMFCVTLSWRGANGIKNFYLEFRPEEPGYDHRNKEVVREILLGTPILVFHNAKFDLQKLVRKGILGRKDLESLVFEDTEALFHLQDEHSRKGLKYLAQLLLGETTTEEQDLKVVRRKLKLKKSDGYHKIPREYLEPYALKDTEYTLKLYEYLKPKLPEDVQYLYELEGRLTLALLDVEAAGMGVDMEYVKGKLIELGDLAMLKHLEIQKYVPELNPNSPKQLIEFFATQGIKCDSVDKAHLEELDHPVAKLIIELRQINKVRNTYFKALLEESEDKGMGLHILHTQFRQHQTVTGRMSSGEAQR